MAIWVELRCERRSNGRAEYSKHYCWSDGNDGPGALTDENQQSVIRTLRELKEEAIKAGWKSIRGEGLVCQSCLAFEESQKEVK